MDKVSIHKYIFLGTSLRYLQDCRKGWLIHATEDGYYVADNIRIFIEELKELNLHVTERASSELVTLYGELREREESETLTQEDATKLAKLMKEIRPTFEAECKGIYALITSDKKYSIQRLTSDIGELFSPGVFTKLSDIAISDFNEAGFCIAYERPTAAAFHLLRGCEEVVRQYYKKFIRGKTVPKTWGQITTDLKNKNKGKKPDPIVINQLIHIKDAFRNPTNHPEKIYDIHEAQDLLGLCIDIVNRMSKAL